jgi:hypothetical protein
MNFEDENLRAVAVDGFVPNIPMRIGSSGSTSEPGVSGNSTFRRQHRIDAYFDDFCCMQQNRIIELDGTQHAEREE